MKKEGIQTRNRKLSSKSKKKKGGMGMGGGGACALALGGVMGDMIKPLGDATKGFGGSAFPSAMDFGKSIFYLLCFTFYTKCIMNANKALPIFLVTSAFCYFIFIASMD